MPAGPLDLINDRRGAGQMTIICRPCPDFKSLTCNPVNRHVSQSNEKCNILHKFTVSTHLFAVYLVNYLLFNNNTILNYIISMRDAAKLHYSMYS